MDYRITLENKFIPEWNNNKNLRENEQIVIIWKWPTGYDKEACLDIGVKDGKTDVRINYIRLVERCIVKIKNLAINGKPITNGFDLLNQPGLSSLSDEVRLFMIPKLAEIDEKN